VLSGILHLGMIATLPRPAAGTAAAPMLVLLLRQTSPEPARPAPIALPLQHQGFAPVRPHLHPRSPLGQRAIAPSSVTPRVSAMAPALVREPLFGVDVANNELTAAQEAEKLSTEQLRVPKGNTLAQEPQEMDRIRPTYPPEELKRGERARVLLEAFISAGGAVEDVVILDDQGKPAFAAAAAQAVRRVPFRPARDAQGTVRSRITLAFRFTFE
jgi:TonB family protein